MLRMDQKRIKSILGLVDNLLQHLSEHPTNWNGGNYDRIVMALEAEVERGLNPPATSTPDDHQDR